MKLSSVETVYDFMRYCRMPLYCQREIRDMKVGDIYYLGQYKEKIPEEDDEYLVAEAWIEKERGIYKFYGTWTFPTKPSRPLIMTWGDFKILNAGIIRFCKDGQGVQQFALVSRYLDSLVMKMSREEQLRYLSAGSKPLFRGVWMNKDYIDRKEHVKYEGKSLRRYRVDYSKHAPTHQLQAIITAGIALNQINE